MMLWRTTLTPFVTLWLVLCSLATRRLGPVTDLHIVNANISTDGFTRAAVLAEGTFPGPVITAKKASPVV